MMENVRKISKKYYFRQVMACWLVSLMLFGIPAKVVLATPNGGTFTVGTGTIGQVGNTTNVVVDQLQSVVEWGGLDTSSIETLAFSQGGLSNSAVLNRVISGIPTQFDGALTAADMRIFIVNPAGLAFGPTAYIQARNFVGSTLDISNTDFLAGDMIFQGGGGILENQGTIEATDSVYLVGGDVINTGTIICDGGVIAMAATVDGRVIISREGSNVIVEIQPAEELIEPLVLSEEPPEIILGSGDIYSAAIENIKTLTAVADRDVVIEGRIYASSVGESSAVATVEIEAGRDVTINDEIYVETTVTTGIPEDDAISTIEISAGGSVFINDRVVADARAGGGSGDATATIGIDAGEDVVINADTEGYTVYADAETYKASGDATADIEIDAGDSLTVEGGSEIYAEADTDYSGDAAANVDIATGGDVTVIDYSEIEADAEADYESGDATSGITVNAGGDVLVENDSEICADAYSYDESGDATAGIDIVTGGSVSVIDDSDIETYAESYSGDATATVDIDAGGDVIVGDALVGDDESEICTYAEAYGNESDATAIADIFAGGDVIVESDSEFCNDAYTYDGAGDATAGITVKADNVTADNSEIYAEAYAYNGSGDAAATVDIATTSSEVIVENGSYLWAYASTYGGSGDAVAKTTVTAENVTVSDESEIYAGAGAYDGSGDATATVVIDASGNVLVEEGEDADTWIWAEAHTGMGEEEVGEGSGDATAIVDIDAGGYVTVTGDEDDEDYGAGIWAEAYAYDGSGDADATVDIDAAGDVTAESSGEYAAIVAIAETEDSGDATANVDIDAGDSVIVKDGGEIYAQAINKLNIKPDPDMLVDEGDNVIDLTVGGHVATATVDITATNVEITSNEGESSEVWAEAKNEVDIELYGWEFELYELTVNLTVEDLQTNADVTIAAGENVNVEGKEGWSYAGIGAEAHNEFGVEGSPWVEQDVTLNLTIGDLENNAGIDITAGDDVKVQGQGYDSRAEVEAEAYNELWDESGLNVTLTGDNIVNNAAVDIDAGDNVRVIADNWKGSGTAGIIAEAYNDGEGLSDEPELGDYLPENIANNASIDITAGDKVEVYGEWGGDAEIYAGADYGTDNTANVTVDNGGDVEVRAENGGEASIEASAMYGTDNIATIGIDTGGNVEVIDIGESVDTAKIEAWTQYALNSNTSDITINATTTVYEREGKGLFEITEGGNVEVRAENGGNAQITAFAGDAEGVDDCETGEASNSANVTIATDGGDVLVYSIDGHAEISATATDAENSNTATIDIDAVGGNVEVIDIGESVATAKIEAWAQYAGNSNTADVQIDATATETVFVKEVDEGVFEEFVEIEGGDVKVISRYGGNAEITAFAGDAEGMYENGDKNGYVYEMDETSNTANVTIRTTAVEVTELVLVQEPVYSGEAPYEELEPAVYEEVVYLEGGNVEVDAGDGGRSVIQAVTLRGGNNDSDVLICAEGHVEVLGGYDEPGERNWDDATALIKSIAHFGTINNAYTGISAGSGVEVRAGHSSGEASIASKAFLGQWEMPAEENTAFTSICTNGDVEVIDICRGGGDASIIAKTWGGIDNTSTVGVCAEGHVVVVAADIDDLDGMTKAEIKAEAEAASIGQEQYPRDIVPNKYYEDDPTSATAKTTVVSHKGSVIVSALAGGKASIEAEAHNGDENIAEVGVAAGKDLTLADVLEELAELAERGDFGDIEGLEDIYDLLDDDLIPAGHVIVYSEESDSEAQILAYAYNGFDENTADTVVCAPGEVVVETEGEGGIARIKSQAGQLLNGNNGYYDATNRATTQVYASDVWVSYDAYIEAVTPYDWKSVSDDWSLGDGLPQWEVDGGATLLIDGYSQRQDCPDCLPCPECEEGEEDILKEAAPLPGIVVPGFEQVTFAEGGCPALMVWLADELGVPTEDIQIFIANTFALSTDTQPCEVCARLKNAADILDDDAMTAALTQVVNEFITTPAPPSEEQMTSIATAFADHAGDGTYYAAAGEWIDALVTYVSIMTDEMGWSAGDSVAMLLAKHGLPEGTDATVVAYVQSRLAALGG